MKPATPLPWKADGDEVIDTAAGTVADVFGDTSEDRDQNAAYIAHAANLYPEMLDFIDSLSRGFDNLSWEMQEWRRRILAKCEGEWDRKNDELLNQ